MCFAGIHVIQSKNVMCSEEKKEKFRKLWEKFETRDRVFLSAEEWNLTFKFHKLGQKMATNLIFRYAEELIKLRIYSNGFNWDVLELYKNEAYRRLKNRILDNPVDVNVSFVRENIKYRAYQDALRKRKRIDNHEILDIENPGMTRDEDGNINGKFTEQKVRAPDRDQLDKMICEEQERVLNEFIDQLSPNQRTVIENIYRDGLTHEDAADQSGIGRTAVTARHISAKKKLRKELNNLDEDKDRPYSSSAESY